MTLVVGPRARARRGRSAKWGGCALLLAMLALAGCDDTTNPGLTDFGTPDVNNGNICEATGELVIDEVCDGRDNDCDGEADEQFNLNTDARNCGQCGRVCDFGNVDSACANGQCIPVGGCPEGFVDTNMDLTDGCEDTCPEIRPEECNDRDDDCDGRVDEHVDKNTNVFNCGRCDNVCAFDNARPFCDDGLCRIRQCEPGWGDCNNDDRDGCECICNPRFPGPELCDGEDNDCDGMVDEDFDTQQDGEHCGECGNRCGYANAAAVCREGECMMGQCDEGFVDRDESPENGCEQRCSITNEGLEICDDIDNDCNGVVDDGFDKQNDGQNCGGCGALDERFICRLPNAESTCREGECAIAECVPGFADADGQTANGCERPCVISNNGVEDCNGEDDDCDGQVDEGYDLATNIAHCGECNNRCRVDRATPVCDDGECVLRAEQCDDGWVDADQDILTGCEYRCTPSEDRNELCNTADDDCDGLVDEGYDIMRELAHCGGCDQLCNPANAIALCNDGQCDIGGCLDGWFDANGILEDGCEVECVPSNNGIEACDEIDNDCDDRIDEDFDLDGDVFNCGQCGNACDFPNGQLSCVDRVCRVEGCLDGWYDVDNAPANGCEYRCVVTNGGDEICDNRDNDCDGRVDEEFDLDTSLDHCGACNNPCVAENAVTGCNQGRCRLERCIPGFVDLNRDPTDGCEFACRADPDGREFCNAVDDDCDGVVDEGFDLDNDLDNCGGCGSVCDVANGTPFCNGGDCAILTCQPGFVDLDLRTGNGCECRLSNGGIETCDGLDNDCNGVVDDPERVVPPPDFRCLSLGVCEGASPICEQARWRCEYDGVYEEREQSCDGLDNDCNGVTDEVFEELGRPCSEGEGICREEGRLECAGIAGIGCTARARNDRARAEECNGLDDDCDGNVDEGSDLLVQVPAGDGLAAFTIYAYEATRTDADEETSGQSFARACSKPDALPWVDVDYATAQAACEAAGLRLCTGAEWGRACAGALNEPYPYGRVYDPQRCNGQEYDSNPVTPENEDDLIPTGTARRCSRDLGGGPVFDLSGNVWEWTSQDLSPGGDGSARALRGGSSGNIDGGLTCQFTNATPPASFRANIGFRCCGSP